ncbi:hypothetical protein [Nocardia brasiliensis]|uniref:hypothetical protein n=1 Tax=Nocardia brasiliensis TaxID=37326 RepID=UPI0018934E83|nr:hypothetical protein [Nocardia brasiliensis]MBF6130430.1 hypothetical protein [Nocardia brasiliensis]
MPGVDPPVLPGNQPLTQQVLPVTPPATAVPTPPGNQQSPPGTQRDIDTTEPPGPSTPGRHGPIPEELFRPAACDIPGLRVLNPGQVHEIVTRILGPLEDEDPSSSLVRRTIDLTNQLNRGCYGTEAQIAQKVWEEVRDEWYKVYRDRNINRDRTKTKCDYKGDTSKDCEGIVAVCLARGQDNLPDPQRANLIRQRDAYIAGGNDYIQTNMFPAWRIRTTDTPEGDQAGRLAQQWRESHPADYPTGDGVDRNMYPSGKINAGHVPDTMWTGPPPPKPNPYRWLPLDESLNKSIGAQGKQYPENYKARAFVPGDWVDGKCLPSATTPAMPLRPPGTR